VLLFPFLRPPFANRLVQVGSFPPSFFSAAAVSKRSFFPPLPVPFCPILFLCFFHQDLFALGETYLPVVPFVRRSVCFYLFPQAQEERTFYGTFLTESLHAPLIPFPPALSPYGKPEEVIIFFVSPDRLVRPEFFLRSLPE